MGGGGRGGEGGTVTYQLIPKSADLVAGLGGRSEVGRVGQATDEDQRSASPSKISHGHLCF